MGIPEGAVVSSFIAGHASFGISAPLTADLTDTKLVVDPGVHTLTLAAADTRIRVGQLVVAEVGIAPGSLVVAYDKYGPTVTLSQPVTVNVKERYPSNYTKFPLRFDPLSTKISLNGPDARLKPGQVSGV